MTKNNQCVSLITEKILLIASLPFLRIDFLFQTIVLLKVKNGEKKDELGFEVGRGSRSVGWIDQANGNQTGGKEKIGKVKLWSSGAKNWLMDVLT